MSDQHAPSYFADQGAENIYEKYSELFGNDFGPDLPFDDAYDHVESNGVEAQEPVASEDPGQAGSGTNKEALGSTVHDTSSPAQPSFDVEDLPAAHLSEEDETWREREGLSDFQYSAGNNNQQQPQIDFNSEKWKRVEEAIIADREFQEIVGPIHQGQSSQGNSSNIVHPTPSRVDSRRPTTLNRPIMNSARGTTIISRETTRGPAPTASNGLGNTIYNPENSAAVEVVRDAESDDEDREGEGNEEGNEDEDVPNYVNLETFEENDPLIVTNPHRPGRGRTGMRNGHQVWFDPRTSKWRKLQLLYPI